MATENSLRFIRVDYQAHKDALLQRVRARYPRVWNDFLNNSFGIVLVDLIAWSTATMAFLVNRAAGENYVNTMTLRESAVNIGSLTGYELRGPTAASVACEASITAPLSSATVTIAKGTVIRSSSQDSIAFEVEKDYFILPGNTTPVTPIATISPSTPGASVLSTFVNVTPGSSNADLLDTTINLADFVQAGQVFKVDGEAATYLISDIQASPGAVSNNRLVLATPYAGAVQASATATIYDQRINCLQGLTVRDSFVSPSDATPAFVFKLSTTPVIDGSVDVFVNGSAWNQVISFAKSTVDSTDYVFKTTASGQPLIIFGDGTLGLMIPTDATINAAYRVGGGTAGNIALNSINTSITALIASTTNPITIQITNTTSAGTGGREAETLEEARVNIPAMTRANDRSVTLEDYQTMAMSYPGVVFARATVRTENALLEGNIVFIYAWTSGPVGSLVNLNASQKIELENFMQTKALGTDLVRIGDGTARPIPVSMRYKVFQGFSVTDTGLLVQDTLNSFVDILRPGQPVPYSNLVRALDEVYGVDTIAMSTPTSDLYPSNSLELWTKPNAEYIYGLSKQASGTPIWSNYDLVSISLYSAQLVVYPISAWSLRMFLGTKELTIQPGIIPGTAQVFGENLSGDLAYPSTINLLTGAIALWIKGVPGDLSMKLIPVSGYASDKLVNVYVGFAGNTSQSKRREIRSAIRAWGDGLLVGSPIYGSEIAGITGSKSSITEVVRAVTGVTSVNRVALDTPGSTSKMASAVETELLRIGECVINNFSD
jgi:hypothetical protein